MRAIAHSRQILIGLGLMAAAVVLMVACGGFSIGGNPSFPISDARELLTKSIDRTLALETVHLEAQLLEAGNFLGGPEGARLQANVDLAEGEVSLQANSTEAQAPPVGLVVADGSAFVSSGGKWSVTPLAQLDPMIAGMIPSREVLTKLI